VTQAGRSRPALPPARNSSRRSESRRSPLRLSSGIISTALAAVTTMALPAGPAHAATTPVLTAGQSSPGSTLSPQWAFTSDPTDTTDCRTVDAVGDPVNGVDWAPCSSPYTASLPDPSQGDGTYTVEVRATDSGGGTATASDDYVLDTTGPTATFTATPATPGSDVAPTWDWSLSDGSAECKLDTPPAGPAFDWSPCAGPETLDLTTAPPGLYSLSVRGVDTLGNVGGVITADYLYDPGLPGAPTVAVVTSSPGQSTSVQWTFSTDPTDSTECRLLQDGAEVITWAGCSSPDTIDLTTLPSHGDGTYRLEVRATDLSGNTGPAGGASYVLDTTAPVAPSLTSTPGALGKTTTPTWTFTTDPSASTAQCKITAPGDPGAWAVCASPYSPTLTDGETTYTLHLRDVDLAGNVSGAVTDDYTLDQTPPPAPSLSGPTGPSQDPAPSYTFTLGGDAVSAQCSVVDPANNAGPWAACTSPYNPALGSGDGVYKIDVRARDAAGNTSTVVEIGYDWDTTGPAAPAFVNPPTGPSGDATVSWTFTTEANATTECSLVGPASSTAFASCASGDTFSLTQGDGAYHLDVRATDQAGNLGQTASSPDYLLDTSGPSVDLTGPASPGTSNKPIFSWTTEAGATTQCAFDTPTTTGTFAPCTSPFKPTLATEGSYTLHVQATDQAGNLGTESVATYVYDATPPATPTVTVAPSSPGNSTAVTFTWSAETNATSTCKLTGPGLAGNFISCSSPDALTLPSTEGTYTFAVLVTDQAGNASAQGKTTYTLDLTAPVAPAVNGPASPSTASSGNFSWSTEPNATSQCRFTPPGGPSGSWAPCSSPVSENFGPAQGTYTVDVRVTDLAGNTGPTGSATYVYDTVAPGAPVVTGPTGPSNNPNVTWTFTTDPNTTTQCQRVRNGTPVTQWTACTSPRNVTLASEGTWHLDVRATDLAGNVGPTGSSPDYTLDMTGPTITLVGPATPGNNQRPTWSWTTEANATTECKFDGPGAPGQWATCVSPYTPAANLSPDGTYTLSVRGTDSVGNLGSAASAAYVLDTAPPASPTFLTEPVSPANVVAPTWTFRLPADGTGQCQLLLGATVEAPWAPCSSPYTPNLAWGDGVYTLQLRAIDTAGNVSAPAQTSKYTLDTQAPAAPIVTPPSGTTSNDQTPTWTIAGEPGATVSCTVREAGLVVATKNPCPAQYAVDLSSDPDATYTLDLLVTDAAGNIGGPYSTTYILDTTPPASPVVNGPTGPSASTNVTWTFSAEAGAATTCRLVSNGAPGTWSACSSPWMKSLPPTSGSYVLQVEATDAAGNSSVDPGSSPTYVLDLDPPAAPLPGIVPGSPNSDRSPRWTFTPEANTTTTCQLSGGGTILDTTSCASSYVADLTGQPDGDYTFTAWSTDEAGNVGPPLVLDYVLDSTVPGAPTVTKAPPSPSNNLHPRWSFVGDSGVTFHCTVTRGVATVMTVDPCTSPFTASLVGEPDGTYVFGVSSTDAAGNMSSTATATYLLDTAAPARPHFTHRPASPAQQRRPSWSWTAEPGTTASCQFSRGGTVLLAWSDCGATFTRDLAGRVDGDYVLSVRVTDVAGNTSEAASSGYVLDTTPPAPPRFTSLPDSPDSDHTPTWAWAGAAGSAASCLVTSGGNVVRDWAPCSSPHTVSLGGEPDGLYRLRVRLTDAAGNTGASGSDFYTLDSTVGPKTPPPPPPPHHDPSGGTPQGSPPPTSPQHTPGPPSTVPPPTKSVPPASVSSRGHVLNNITKTLKHLIKRSDETLGHVVFPTHVPSLTEVPGLLSQVAVKSLEKPQFPLVLLVVAALFLLVQNRIDRRDPKLATAPVDAEPHLFFGPAVGA
jgi:hypothetical protein